jgi:hypothetical protein
MATTYTFIDKATLSSTANYIEFTSIPSTYTDLILLSALRSNRSAVNDQGDVKLNGTSITGKTLQGDGSGAGSEPDAYLRPPANNATANVFSNDVIYIPNYASSTQYKSVSIDGVMENNATGSYAYLCAGLYSSNTAVSSVRITCLNASWVSGSSVYLYGIKNS